MREWPSESVDLCYLDPPFNSDANYNILFGKGLPVSESVAQMTAFEDTWKWDDVAQERVDRILLAIGNPSHFFIDGMHKIIGECGMLAYLSYMAERVTEIWRVLKNHGSLYFHCDATASHYLKVMLDNILNKCEFRREIIWANEDNSGFKANASNWVRGHDTILYYVKNRGGGRATFQKLYTPYSKEYIDKMMKHVDENGRRYRLRGRKRYYEDENGVRIPSVWTGIKSFQTITQSEEYLKYPTQKRLPILERIINASSNPGDIVLDPFCGCGTTVEAAKNLNRQFLGIDISHFAIDVVRERRLKDSSIPVHGFPRDLRSAEMMVQENPLEFEKWAITRIHGMIPNQRQVGDGGIDGRGRIYMDKGLVLSQVKGKRSIPLGDVRDFCHVMNRENAKCGIFISLRTVTSLGAKTEMKSLGSFEMGISNYPRGQLWSIEEYFNDRMPSLPALADPITGDEMMYEDVFNTAK